MSHPMLIRPNKTELLKGKKVVFLVLLKHYCSKNKYQNLIRGEVVLTAAHLINRVSSKVLGFKSLIEVFAKPLPNCHTSYKLSVKVFRCVAFVHMHAHNREKLDPRALRCVFVGLFTYTKGLRMLSCSF